MKKIIASLVAAVAVALPAHSDPLKDSEFFTYHSMGCMLLQECTDDVRKITSIDGISDQIPDTNYSPYASEFNSLIRAFDTVGVNVFLADQKYFPVGHRGVYHTVSNNFFLNQAYMHRPRVLMSVMRHEGWHAAQDCMAGTIENNMIAIIHNEEDVPMMWQELVKRTYKDNPRVIPWEKEAYWAGKTEGMTVAALESCARGTMWEDFTPTPQTREWLVKNGYLK